MAGVTTMDRGEPLDASLAALRQQGASIIESVRAVREANLVSSLMEAKRLVEASSAWEGGREARRQFVDEITAPHSGFPQSAGIRLFTIRDALWLTVVVLVAAILYNSEGASWAAAYVWADRTMIRDGTLSVVVRIQQP